MRTLRGALAVVCVALLCGAAAAGAAAKKSVIKVATAAPTTGQYFQEPEYISGMKAALAVINAKGGVAGHQVSLQVCDTDFTANGEVACAHSLVADHPAALVGPFFVADSTGAAWPLFKAAGIPAIGEQGGTAAEMNSSNVFPLGSSFLGPYVGTAAGIVKAGANKVAILTDNPNPNGPTIAQIITGALNARGVTDVRSITGYTASDPTFSTAASQAMANGTNGIIINGSPNDSATMIKALRGAGYKGHIAVASLLMPPQTIKALGSLANGIIVADGTQFVTDTANHFVQAYLKGMAKYAKGAAIDDASMQGWSAMQLFAAAAAQSKSFTPAGLMKTFSSIKKPIKIGTSAPWSVVGKLGKVKGFSRLVNPDIALGIIINGKVVPEKGGWVNPLG